jgi:hypothetical protein
MVFQHLPGRGEENHENLQKRIVFLYDIRIDYLPNESQKSYSFSQLAWWQVLLNGGKETSVSIKGQDFLNFLDVSRFSRRSTPCGVN